MSEILEFESEYGPIMIEMDTDPYGGEYRSGGRGGVSKAEKKFSQAIDVVKSIGDSIVDRMNSIKKIPDEVSVEVGLKFSSEAGAFLAKASSEGNIKVTFKWKNESIKK